MHARYSIEMSAGTSLYFWIALAIAISSIQGGCEFKKSWVGRWFQSGVQNTLYINATHIETKGECYEEQADKYLVYDKTEDCYRCMAIHEKHPSVLQYKETYCDSKGSLQDICFGITGDAPLYSMFRKYPEAKPVACPFKSAPFIFSYNRGSGDCGNPPSKAESCTDDSRLVLKYQACPDISSTESNIEELVCLATWKEGSTRYLIGRIYQGNRRNLISDEDQYRCFIYQRSSENGRTVYNVAQSGDATCNGIQNAFEGSRTMKLTTVDTHHYRCKFPNWITDHHTWISLDHHRTYRFSQKNATLRIMIDDQGETNWFRQRDMMEKQQRQFDFQEMGFESQDQRRRNSEMRVVCHNILMAADFKKVQIVAHVTAGCYSGYVCMMFYKRDTNVIEVQQSDDYFENPDEACTNFNAATVPYATLINNAVATNLQMTKCPHWGRYTLYKQPPPTEQQEESPPPATAAKRRKKRQGYDDDSLFDHLPPPPPPPECPSHDYNALSVGCGGTYGMEFKSACPSHEPTKEFACHGSWEENGVSYVITSPLAKRSSDSSRYCFIYTLSNQPDATVIEGGLGHGSEPSILRFSGVTESCHRYVTPGVGGEFAFNFTIDGTCTSDGDSGVQSVLYLIPSALIVSTSVMIILIYR